MDWFEFEYLQNSNKNAHAHHLQKRFIGWTQYYPSTVLSVRYWNAKNTKKKFVKVNVECVVFSSVNSNKFVCFVLFCSPVQTWSKRPTTIAWEGDSIFYRLLDSIRLESNPACCCMVSDVNRRPLVVLGYIANSWTAYRLLNPNKTNTNFLI